MSKLDELAKMKMPLVAYLESRHRGVVVSTPQIKGKGAPFEFRQYFYVKRLIPEQHALKINIPYAITLARIGKIGGMNIYTDPKEIERDEIKVVAPATIYISPRKAKLRLLVQMFEFL